MYVQANECYERERERERDREREVKVKRKIVLWTPWRLIFKTLLPG